MRFSTVETAMLDPDLRLDPGVGPARGLEVARCVGAPEEREGRCADGAGVDRGIVSSPEQLVSGLENRPRCGDAGRHSDGADLVPVGQTPGP